jgi:hypothetical protein
MGTAAANQKNHEVHEEQEGEKIFFRTMPSHLPIFVSLATFVAKGSVKILDIGGFPKPRK